LSSTDSVKVQPQHQRQAFWGFVAHQFGPYTQPSSNLSQTLSKMAMPCSAPPPVKWPDYVLSAQELSEQCKRIRHSGDPIFPWVDNCASVERQRIMWSAEGCEIIATMPMATVFDDDAACQNPTLVAVMTIFNLNCRRHQILQKRSRPRRRQDHVRALAFVLVVMCLPQASRWQLAYPQTKPLTRDSHTDCYSVGTLGIASI